MFFGKLLVQVTNKSKLMGYWGECKLERANLYYNSRDPFKNKVFKIELWAVFPKHAAFTSTRQIASDRTNGNIANIISHLGMSFQARQKSQGQNQPDPASIVFEI